MHDRYITSAPRRPTIDRDALVRVAERLKAEHERIMAECAKRVKAGKDYDDLWAAGKGTFFAYRQVADLLGWQ